jgi:hypothetical protein
MSEKNATPHTVLQLCFKLRVKPDLFLAHSQEPAATIAAVKGLIWKIWVYCDEGLEVGGVYLFCSREAAENYLSHPVIQAVRNNPAVASTESKLWDVEDSLSAITRAPLPKLLLEQPQPVAFVAGGE